MSQNHEVTSSEMHTYDADTWTGDPSHYVETWVKCSCGWEAGTWGDHADGPGGLAGIRANRDAAIDEHMTETHRYSMRSTWVADPSGTATKADGTSLHQ